MAGGSAPWLTSRAETSGSNTVFHYSQEGDEVSARYKGGAVRLGYLVGTRAGDELDFRCVHLRADGTTASGHCRSQVQLLQDGRLRLEETWEWESQPGNGTSAVEELL